MALFPSTLIISDNLDYLLPELEQIGHSLSNNPDIFYVDQYTIETIREIGTFLSKQPYNHNSKIIVIKNADLLNTESQNALLKNLEEPGENNFFILQTTRPSALLDTIISRCQIIKTILTPKDNFPPLQFTGSISDRLFQTDQLSLTKENVLPYLDSQIQYYHQQLISQPVLNNQVIITKLLKAESMSRANVDPKSVIDFLLLS